MRCVRARTAHEIPDRPPLQLAVGQQVQVGERDREWPEFVLVTASQGGLGAGATPVRAVGPGDCADGVRHDGAAN